MTWGKKKAEFGMVRSCASKVVFEHEWQAIGCCKKLHRKKKRYMKPYKCDVCGKFHTATVSRSEFGLVVYGTVAKEAP